jgi:hypothetical protein
MTQGDVLIFRAQTIDSDAQTDHDVHMRSGQTPLLTASQPPSALFRERGSSKVTDNTTAVEATTPIAEAQVKRANEIKAAQSKARAASKGKPAAKPAKGAAKAERVPVPSGQSRSRGRLILSSTGSNCTAGKGCGNPARWPVGRHPAIAKANGFGATIVSCTTHLRAAARKAGLVNSTALETELIAIAAGRGPKARAPRAAKPAAQPTAG